MGSSLSVAEEVFLGSSPLLHSLPYLSAFVLCRHSHIPKGRFWCVALPTWLAGGTVWTDKIGSFVSGIRLRLAKHLFALARLCLLQPVVTCE